VPERASTPGRAATTRPAAYVLSAVEFDVVWRGLGLGSPPVVLQVPSPGRTHTERRWIEAHAWTALRERGLVGVAERLLGLLASSSARVEVRAWGASACRAVVAGRGDRGVLARSRGDTVVVQPCGSVPGAVGGLLAGGRPGPGRAACVPAADLAAVLRRPSGTGLRTDLVARGVDPVEAGLVARMLHAVSARSQVAVVGPDRRRSLLELLDGPRGRYLMRHTPDGAWTTVAPVDDRRLRAGVAKLLEPGAQSRSPCRISCLPASVIEPDREG